MKKSNLFFVLLTALIVMSCSKDETTMSIPQESNAIEFGTYVGRDAQTRASVTDLAALQVADVGFGVFAYYTEGTWASKKDGTYPNFMYNQQIKWNSTKWEYSPIKYWPTTKTDEVSFFAFAPYTSTLTDGGFTLPEKTAKDTPKIIYKIPTDASQMIDFVAANAIGKNGTPSATPPIPGANNDATKVTFNFKHELSRVLFKAKPSQLLLDETEFNKTYINIKSATLNSTAGLLKKATYTFSDTDNTAGSWEGSEFFSSYSIGNVMGFADASANNTTIPGYSVAGKLISVADAVSIFTDDQYLFLIPATIATGMGLAEGDATITFEYDIVTIDDKLLNKHSVTSATKTVNLPGGTLKQGVAYTYTFTFNVDQVVVDASVSAWTEPTTEDETEVDYTHDN